jgi:hypothetical protein
MVVSDREFLRRIRRLIVNGRTKGVLARDRDGKKAEPESPKAASWCLAGASIRAGCPGIVGLINPNKKSPNLARKAAASEESETNRSKS